mgnify:CR=1 FL=1
MKALEWMYQGNEGVKSFLEVGEGRAREEGREEGMVPVLAEALIEKMGRVGFKALFGEEKSGGCGEGGVEGEGGKRGQDIEWREICTGVSINTARQSHPRP